MSLYFREENCIAHTLASWVFRAHWQPTRQMGSPKYRTNYAQCQLSITIKIISEAGPLPPRSVVPCSFSARPYVQHCLSQSPRYHHMIWSSSRHPGSSLILPGSQLFVRSNPLLWFATAAEGSLLSLAVARSFSSAPDVNFSDAPPKPTVRR